MSPRQKRGHFVTVEGLDGTGKSTQIELLARYLRGKRIAVVTTREPGGTRLGNKIRRLLLAKDSRPIAPVAELALMYAARAQHLAEVIRPALARGALVLSDRYSDSSFAYQGGGRKLGFDRVGEFEAVVADDVRPDLTVLLDQPPRTALRRAHRRSERAGESPTAFEREANDFFTRVRAAYLRRARAEPKRIRIVRADRPVEVVQAEIRKIMDRVLAAPAKSRTK